MDERLCPIFPYIRADMCNVTTVSSNVTPYMMAKDLKRYLIDLYTAIGALAVGFYSVTRFKQ